jgi:sporulation protein YlmC with PRC-barrel domain
VRFSEAHHRQVVATATARKLGRVEGFVVEPGPARVTALRLGGTHRGQSLLSYRDLKAFGTDAVTVDDEGPLRPPLDADEERRAGKDHDLLGKPALLETGELIGTVQDVEFDPADGTVRAVVTSAAELPGASLVGVGSYAAVFTASD